MRRRIITLLLALLTVGGISLVVAPQASAVVPPGCTTHIPGNVMRVDRNGNFLGWSSHYDVYFGYSTSGASVKMTSVSLENTSYTDNKTYVITTDRWESAFGATIYNGPGGSFTPVYPWSWIPSSQLWLAVSGDSGHPVYSLWGYDQNYPSVGAQIVARPCGV